MATGNPPVHGAGLTRNRVLWITGLWLAAGLILVVQSIWFHELNAPVAQSDHHAPLMPSAAWRSWGTLVPLFLATAAIMLHVRWVTVNRQLLGIIGGLLLTAAYCLGAFLASQGPYIIGSVTLRDGRYFMLAAEPTRDNGTGYSVHETVGSRGLYWRRVADLGISWDLRSVDEELVLAPDERWLLVAVRGFGSIASGCPADACSTVACSPSHSGPTPLTRATCSSDPWGSRRLPGCGRPATAAGEKNYPSTMLRMVPLPSKCRGGNMPSKRPSQNAGFRPRLCDETW